MKKEQVDQMTLQEACDYAVLKIVEQGGRCGYYSMNDFYNCEYGNDSGKHCAVGWLLDENNVGLMSYNDGVHRIIDEYFNDVPRLIIKNLCVFNALQNFHDAHIRDARVGYKRKLSDLGVDTSTPQYQQWVEMANE